MEDKGQYAFYDFSIGISHDIKKYYYLLDNLFFSEGYLWKH